MTRAATQDQINDHRRDHLKHEWRPGDPMPLDQRCALAKLIGYSESIADAGLIGETMETKLRQCIAETLVAFNMPAKGQSARPIDIIFGERA